MSIDSVPMLRLGVARRRIAPAVPVVMALLAGGALIGIPIPARSAPAELDGRGWVQQVGTYDYLVQPDFDGLLPLREAVGDTTIGLGTFDRLDGELVMVAGIVYRVGTDGIPREVDLDRTTPFFEAVRFQPQAAIRIETGTTCADLTAVIDDLAGSASGMVAVRVTGRFEALAMRSIPRQTPPYAPLPEVLADQVVFPLTDVRGGLVGFRTGPDLLGVGQPGLHLHGITRAAAAGGHVLSCTVGSGTRLRIQRVEGVRLLAGG